MYLFGQLVHMHCLTSSLHGLKDTFLGL